VIGDHSRPYYPAFLDLKGHLVVVVGGEAAAERAVLSLLRYQADIIVIAPSIAPALDALVAEGIVEHEERDYIRGDLAGAVVAISTTTSVEVNRAIYKEAEGTGCMVSVLDDPALSNFITPAVVQRGPFQLAISTAGAAPEVARDVHRELDAEYGAEWEKYVVLLADVRRIVYERVPDAESECEIIFTAIADSDVRQRIASGQTVTPEGIFHEFVFGDGPGEHDAKESDSSTKPA